MTEESTQAAFAALEQCIQRVMAEQGYDTLAVSGLLLWRAGELLASIGAPLNSLEPVSTAAMPFYHGWREARASLRPPLEAVRAH